VNYIKIIAVVFCIFPGIQGFTGQNKTLSETLNNISADSLKSHLYFLGNDSLEGRGAGTHGGNSTAEDKFIKHFFSQECSWYVYKNFPKGISDN